MLSNDLEKALINLGVPKAVVQYNILTFLPFKFDMKPQFDICIKQLNEIIHHQAVVKNSRDTLNSQWYKVNLRLREWTIVGIQPLPLKYKAYRSVFVGSVRDVFHYTVCDWNAFDCHEWRDTHYHKELSDIRLSRGDIPLHLRPNFFMC